MATENDPILRSLSRSGGIPGSPLEKLVRQNAYKLVNGTDADDAALDAFIATARKDEFYSASFTAPPGPAKAAGIGIKITEEQRRDIDTGKIVVEAAAKEETASIGTATVQPNATEFDEIRRSGKVAVGR